VAVALLLQYRACLVHFTFLQNFTVAKESYQFEVLNEVYLQNFLHGWVVNHEMNLMMQNNALACTVVLGSRRDCQS
jgi:hypothetical protein